MPSEKEPGFLSVDVPGGVATLEEYRNLFAAAPSNSLKYAIGPAYYSE
jgi:hypothetical protein